MAQVLVLLPDRGFDPTEIAVPWDVLSSAGHPVCFATQTGAVGQADPITLSGEGLAPFTAVLKARSAETARFERLTRDPRFRSPLSWDQVDPEAYELLVLPGGHAPEIRPFCEAESVHRIIRAFFARGALVGAICHGVLPLARTTDAQGAPVLRGRRATALTRMQEYSAWWMTRWRLGDHYRTYPRTVQDEVIEALGDASRFETGGLLPAFATPESPDVGFVVEDGALLTARWPGDAHTWARRLLARLQ